MGHQRHGPHQIDLIREGGKEGVVLVEEFQRGLGSQRIHQIE